MKRTDIDPSILQQFLESATNAADKGQAAFYTPLEFGRKLAEALPGYRPNLVDLNCGGAHLLQAAANATTDAVFGCDIGPGRRSIDTGPDRTLRFPRIQHDLTLLYPLLVDVNWRADLFVLNPPWSLRWHRSRLEALGESSLAAVRESFQNHDGRGRDTIDSTVATLMMALDLMGRAGQGFLIGNNATLQRLMFDPGAPHAALAVHVWWRHVFPGNPMTGEARANFQSSNSKCLIEGEDAFETGVLWFSRGHTYGPQNADHALPPNRSAHIGPTLATYNATKDPHIGWNAVADEVEALAAKAPRYNLWLTSEGLVRTHLSTFAHQSRRTDKALAKALFELNGKRPMQLVMARSERDTLLRHAGMAGHETPWTVDPALVAAVNQALRDYGAERAPLYPLNRIQRLGYLDEQDTVRCTADLGPFKAGRSYDLRSETKPYTRTNIQPGLGGEDETLELTGQDLAFWIKDGRGKERLFMAARLTRDKEHTCLIDGKAGHQAIAFTMEQLAEAFEIPDVPDVARVNPDRHRHHLDALDQLEAFINGGALESAAMPPAGRSI